MKKIIIYSTSSCGYCILLKNWFQEKGIEYEEIDVSQSEEKRNELMEKTGAMAIPVVEIENEIIIGFDKKKLAEILKI